MEEYKKERPKAEDYAKVEGRLVEGIKSMGIEGLSLMLYGSYARGEHVPGRSDIDGILVFPDDVVIDKVNFLKAAAIVNDSIGETNVGLDITPTDLTTIRDGRFNSYARPFAEEFARDSKVVVGRDYRGEFCFELPAFDYQVEIRECLKKTRQNLLLSAYLRENDYEGFVEAFQKTLNGISNCPRRVAAMLGGKTEGQRFSGMEYIASKFPDVKRGPLKWIEFLFDQPSELDAIYNDPDAIKRIWGESLTVLEEMIRGYLEMFPKKNVLKQHQHWGS